MSILSHRRFNIGAIFRRILPAQPCLLCGSSNHDDVCCAACTADLQGLSEERCPVCALPAPGGSVCGECLRHPPAFDHTLAAYRYAFPLDKLIQALKFSNRLILINYFADAIVQRVSTQPDCLIPLPLHPERLRERGFNQSLLLAKRISRRLDVPLLPDACERIRNTTPQSLLPWKERDKNMRQAFICRPEADLHGKHVAIVDDVLTTGASIGELARVLKQAGAREVSAWVIARTLPHSD